MCVQVASSDVNPKDCDYCKLCTAFSVLTDEAGCDYEISPKGSSSGNSVGHEDKRDGLQPMRIIVAASLCFMAVVFASISKLVLRRRKHSGVIAMEIYRIPFTMLLHTCSGVTGVRCQEASLPLRGFCLPAHMIKCGHGR